MQNYLNYYYNISFSYLTDNVVQNKWALPRKKCSFVGKGLKMEIKDLTELGVSAEVAGTILTKVNEEHKGFIPKTRFDEVINERNNLKSQVDTYTEQIEDLSKVKPEELTKEIETLKASNIKAKAEFEAQLMAVQVAGIVDKTIATNKGKNPIAIKPFLSDILSSAKIENDAIAGLDEKIKSLKQDASTSFLFETEVTPDAKDLGFVSYNPKEGGGPTKGASEGKEKSYSELLNEIHKGKK